MTATLHDLVRNNDIDGVRSYIALGKDLNITDKLHRTGLHLAAWSGNLEILQMLIRAKADITKKAMDAFTILHFAAGSNSPRAAECIEFIGRKARAIIHQRSTKGLKSALHIAVTKGRSDIVQSLLEIGLDPFAKTSNGQTAIELAKQNKIAEIYSIVRSFAETRGKEGQQHVASKQENNEDEYDEDDDDDDDDDEEQDEENSGDESEGSSEDEDHDRNDHVSNEVDLAKDEGATVLGKRRRDTDDNSLDEESGRVVEPRR